jgi:Fe-S-cluster formation regulator IscX/YfhJ
MKSWAPFLVSLDDWWAQVSSRETLRYVHLRRFVLELTSPSDTHDTQASSILEEITLLDLSPANWARCELQVRNFVPCIVVPCSPLMLFSRSICRSETQPWNQQVGRRHSTGNLWHSFFKYVTIRVLGLYSLPLQLTYFIPTLSVL